MHHTVIPKGSYAVSELVLPSNDAVVAIKKPFRRNGGDRSNEVEPDLSELQG